MVRIYTDCHADYAMLHALDDVTATCIHLRTIAGDDTFYLLFRKILAFSKLDSVEFGP